MKPKYVQTQDGRFSIHTYGMKKGKVKYAIEPLGVRVTLRNSVHVTSASEAEIELTKLNVCPLEAKAMIKSLIYDK